MLGRLFAKEKGLSQTIAVLHLLDGMTYDEIAPVVGMSASGVRKRMRRMRAQLQEFEDEEQRRMTAPEVNHGEPARP